MKRRVFWILVTLLLFLGLTANSEKPGDTVTIAFEITDNTQNAISARVGMEFDGNIFEFVSAEVISTDVLNMAPTTEKGQFGLLNMSGIAAGKIGTITLRIKESAPAGKYEIKPVVDSVYNAKRETVELTVAGETITVDHVWDDGRVTVEATCYTEGVMTYTCIYCREKRAETIPITEHREGSAVVMKVAKCTENGLRAYPCEICHDILREEIIPALDHVPGEVVVTQQPTCVLAGIKVIQCKNCGRTIQSDPIPPLTHTEVVDKAVAATCTTPGKTEGKHCSACNAVIIAQTAVPAKGHSLDAGVVTQKPTATTEGVLTFTCTVCKAKQTEQIPLCVPGDANGDSKASLNDVLLVIEYDSGNAASINLHNADVNQDDKVSIYDALLIMQYIAGWNVTLK